MNGKALPEEKCKCHQQGKSKRKVSGESWVGAHGAEMGWGGVERGLGRYPGTVWVWDGSDPSHQPAAKRFAFPFFTCIYTSSVLTLGLLRPVAGTGGQSEMLSTQRDEAHSSLC